MNIQETKISLQEPQRNLPPLIKKSITYKLKVPRNVEEKIRYLIRKFPSTEWSGVLFYSHEGSFDDGSLKIICKDIFPMDLGSGTFTSFKTDESVAGYIAENIDLFGCNTGLVHSHHSMGAFLSGTDTSTIREEGADTNCFVSLVVDTKGTYVAAITRKVTSTKTINTQYSGTTYEFFGEGSKYLSPEEDKNRTENRTIQETVIEYFMLDVEIEHVDNPFAYLDDRFMEIESLKKKQQPTTSYTSTINWDEMIEEGNNFQNWMRSKRKESAEAKEEIYCPAVKIEEPTLFGEDIMNEMIDTSKWQPDPKIIHHLVCQLVTSSLIVNENIDLKQWTVRHMEKVYNKIFGSPDNLEFTNWVESYVEFILAHYSDSSIPEDLMTDCDLFYSKIASALCDELGEYTSNPYLEAYFEYLTNYVYE